ncbi:MAG: ABC transporter permease [Planctomycetota bacterium]|nr:ABC transporter permease [Planctomycetota bacterium]
MSFLDFLRTHQSDLMQRSFEHVALCAVTLASSVLIAVPGGIVLTRLPRASSLVMAAASVIQTVPSLALLGLLMVLTGQIGYTPSIVALFLYSLLPILRNTYTGIEQTPKPVQQAALALGMTPWQVLWEVSFPLAMPVIVAGLRTAAILVIGIATLCAFIGAGGLGVFINRGLETVNPNLVMLGVVPVALMALAADGALAWLGRKLSPPQ